MKNERIKEARKEIVEEKEMRGERKRERERERVSEWKRE